MEASSVYSGIRRDYICGSIYPVKLWFLGQGKWILVE